MILIDENIYIYQIHKITKNNWKYKTQKFTKYKTQQIQSKKEEETNIDYITSKIQQMYNTENWENAKYRKYKIKIIENTKYSIQKI